VKDFTGWVPFLSPVAKQWRDRNCTIHARTLI